MQPYSRLSCPFSSKNKINYQKQLQIRIVRCRLCCYVFDIMQLRSIFSLKEVRIALFTEFLTCNIPHVIASQVEEPHNSSFRDAPMEKDRKRKGSCSGYSACVLVTLALDSSLCKVWQIDHKFHVASHRRLAGNCSKILEPTIEL